MLSFLFRWVHWAKVAKRSYPLLSVLLGARIGPHCAQAERQKVRFRQALRATEARARSPGVHAAAEKRKLQPVSAASVNSRLQQPLKSLITKKDSSTAKPQLVAVIGKSKENGNGATVSARDKNPPPVRPPFT